MNQSEATGSHLLVTEKFGHELLSSLTRPDTDEQKDLSQSSIEQCGDPVLMEEFVAGESQLDDVCYSYWDFCIH